MLQVGDKTATSHRGESRWTSNRVVIRILMLQFIEKKAFSCLESWRFIVWNVVQSTLLTSIF